MPNLDTDPLQLLLDILRSKPAPPSEPAAVRELRERLEREIAEIRAAGGVVEVPAEAP